MFRGRFVHSIDSKNRMSLPAGFRQELLAQSSEPPVLTNAHQCLDLFPFADWEAFEQRIVGISSVDPEAQAKGLAEAEAETTILTQKVSVSK